MKQLVLFSLGLFFTITAFSQDLIVKTNGKKIRCHIVSEDSVNVYYTYWQDDLYEIKTLINKNETQHIIYNAKYRNKIARDSSIKKNEIHDANKRFCLTLGILEGGGSILGFDLEIPFSKIFSLQGGAGLFGYGAGIDIHLRPTMRSSFFSLQYWHQGIAETHTQSLLGPAFIFRGRKWFTAQLGLGFALDKGPGLPEDYKQPSVMLTYAIGIYIPI